MPENTTYVRIQGEPFLSRAVAYRDQKAAWHRAWSTFAESKGATGFAANGSALSFGRGNPPQGWTKPKGEDGYSKPKRGQPDVQVLEQMRAQHPEPKGASVYQDAVCCGLRWTGSDSSSGSTSIGDFGMILNGPWVGWIGDAYVGCIPDAEAAVREWAEKYPDRRIGDPVRSWRLPAGLTRITKAEYDLLVAEHRVAQERAAAAAIAAE